MADLEVGGLDHESSITKDVARNAGFYARVLGMVPVYESVNFEDPSMYQLVYADGASSTGREEGSTQEELVAGHLGRRVAVKAALLVGGRAHTFRKEVVEMIDVGLLVLRLVLGVIFIGHGAQKLFGSFGGPRISGFAKMLEQLGVKPAKPMAILAGLAEFVGGILVMLGFLTPLAGLALIAVMIVAVLTVHLKNGFFVTNGGYEFNLALAGIALMLVIAGAGAYSLDSVLGIFW